MGQPYAAACRTGVFPLTSIGNWISHRPGLALLAQSKLCQAAGGSVPFSAKTEYGLVALIELAGQYTSGGVMQVGEIAARQSIPDRYLEQMLTSLRRGGILRSIRGPKGGYQLMRSPSEIRVAEVVQILEGEPQPREGGARETPEFRVLHGLAGELQAARQALLEGATLQQLIERRDEIGRAHV